MKGFFVQVRSFAVGATVLAGVATATGAGFTFLSYNTYYNASHTRNSRGQDALPGFHVSVEVSSLRLDYTLPEGIMPPGWHAGVGIVQPVFNQELYTRSPAPNAPGRKVATSGLGDTTITPFSVGYIGTSDFFGRWAVKLKAPISVPTGEYKIENFINKGRNYLALEPQFGVQIFPRPNITLGANFTYIYNFTNPETHYRSGQEFILEPVAEYLPVKDLWIGVQGYVYRQTTTDKVFGSQAADGRFGSAIGFGPQVRYSARGITLTGKWQHEVAVRNRPDGERFWLQFFVPL